MKKLFVLLLSIAVILPLSLGSKGNLPQRYYVYTKNPVIKNLFTPLHEFPRAFSAELTEGQVKLLRFLGVHVEPVKVYHVNIIRAAGKPACGDEVLHPSEDCEAPDYSCPDGYVCVDCKCVAEEERTCYPDNRYPWGVVKVKGGSGGAGVIVAVLDTGVYVDHPDLKSNIIDCKDTTKRGVKKGCADGNGHGTHVTGTIAANGGPDGLGIYGVAPEANIMAIKVCNNAGLCWGDDIAEGIYYAADNGANIISMSLGSDSPDSQILQAIDYAVERGVLVVAAAGNDGPEKGSIDYPGAYAKVIALAAFDSSDRIPDWSSRGINNGDWIIEEREIEFVAPGVSVESTWNDGCYAYASGTSMATPHISGLAAKYWKGSASETRKYLEELAYNYSTKIFDYGLVGDDIEAGFGLPVMP